MTENRMFKNVETWSPVTGCSHLCSYCWAWKLARTRLKHNPRYSKGFQNYTINDKEFHPLKENMTYFVCSMGDLWSAGCPEDYRDAVLTFLEMESFSQNNESIPNCPETTTLLFLTKNPAMYRDEWPIARSSPNPNYVLGATIETNREKPGHKLWWLNAPTPPERIEEMVRFRELHPHARLFLSIEPIMEFDLIDFVDAIRKIQPEWVYIGLDNHHSNLPEPSEREIWELVYQISKFTEPRIKGRLSRIGV